MKTKHALWMMRPLLLLCAFLCAFMPGPGQKPALILKDSEQKTAVELYEINLGVDVFLYMNKRFGYSALIPPGMAEVVVSISSNGDGLIVASKDGKARYRVSGGRAEFVEGGLQGAFDRALKNIGPGNLLQAAFFKQMGPELSEWQLFWRQDGMIHKRRFVIKNDNLFDCELSYPADEHEKYDESTNVAVINSNFNVSD